MRPHSFNSLINSLVHGGGLTGAEVFLGANHFPHKMRDRLCEAGGGPAVGAAGLILRYA